LHKLNHQGILLGLACVEVDVDAESDLTKAYSILNVPAVAIEGQPGSRIVGAFCSNELVNKLRTVCD
jgi:hypothetical protein